MTQGSEAFDLLVIEDNPADTFLLVKMLKTCSLGVKEIYTADSLEKASQLLISHSTIRAILLDLSLPDSFGLNSYFDIRGVAQRIPVIILTGLTDTDVALEALKKGAQDYLIKGQFSQELLCRSIQYSIERNQNLESLEESEAKYRYMFNSNPFPSFIVDLESLKILEVNNSALETYGYSREEFLQLALMDIKPEEDADKLIHAFAEAEPKVNRMTVKHRKKNGSMMHAEITYYPIRYFGKKAMQAQINDITEKVKLEKELAAEQKLKQQEITAAVLAAQEVERTMLGEELHDNINQIMVSAKLYLDMSIKKADATQAGLLKKSSDYIGMAIEEIRKLSKTLVKPSIGDNSLITILEDLMDTVRLVSPAKIELIHEEFDETLLSEDQQLAIYRIVQEQLNNVLKHAQAKNISVLLNNRAEKVILCISDDGKGFDLSARRKGVGITNITSRTEVLNGKLEIDSAPGAGCQLRVTFDNKRVNKLNEA